MMSLRVFRYDRNDTPSLIGQHFGPRYAIQGYTLYLSSRNEKDEEELCLQFGRLPSTILTPTTCLPPERTTTWQRDDHDQS
jgi:hypothetical protein